MGKWIGYEGVRPGSRSSIEIDFFYCGERCRERIKLQPTPANLEKASNHRLDIIDSINQGTFDYAVTFPSSKRAQLFGQENELTVQAYLETWIDGMQPFLKASTHKNYVKIVNNRLIPALGKYKLRLLTLKIVKEFALTIEGSPKTVGNIISPLRTALADAVDDELIEFSPIENWKIRRRKQQAAIKTDNIDPFDAAERAAILDALSSQSQHQNLVQFWFWTGLRTSELCALDWSDIDFVNSKASINKALTQAARQSEEPKTTAGNRIVDLPDPAIEALKRQKLITWLKNEEVFQNERTQERWSGDQPIRKTMWAHAIKRAGVRYRYPYQCRHSFATMMLNAGEPIQWIANQLGHTDWTFTMRTYTRFMPKEYQDAGSKAVKKYAPSSGFSPTKISKP